MHALSDSLATPWMVAHQAPLSVGFSRWEHWCGLTHPPPGALPHSGIEPMSPESPCTGGWILSHWATWEACILGRCHKNKAVKILGWFISDAQESARSESAVMSLLLLLPLPPTWMRYGCCQDGERRDHFLGNPEKENGTDLELGRPQWLLCQEA